METVINRDTRLIIPVAGKDSAATVGDVVDESAVRIKRPLDKPRANSAATAAEAIVDRMVTLEVAVNVDLHKR